MRCICAGGTDNKIQNGGYIDTVHHGASYSLVVENGW